jgi:hypothetical protein
MNQGFKKTPQADTDCGILRFNLLKFVEVLAAVG